MATCDHCEAAYAKIRSWQRFCSVECRQTYNNKPRNISNCLQSEITAVRKLKGDGAEITIQFASDNARRALDFSIGDIVLVAAISSENGSSQRRSMSDKR